MTEDEYKIPEYFYMVLGYSNGRTHILYTHQGLIYIGERAG